jgi:hypothetical protein
VSARHQVNGWIVFSVEKPVRQKKQLFFVRCGFLASAISPGLRPHVKSGPDVFADALVPIARGLVRRFDSPVTPALPAPISNTDIVS